MSKTTITSEEIELDEIEDLIGSILIRSAGNYRCPKCVSPLGIFKEGCDSWECELCGFSLKIIIPVYEGETHDNIIGYQITEFLPNGYPRLHMIGLFPGGSSEKKRPGRP